MNGHILLLARIWPVLSANLGLSSRFWFVPKLCPKSVRNIETYLKISNSIEIQNALKTASFQWNYIIICILTFSAASYTR